MRVIELLAYSGANYVMQQRGENHEKRRIYFYGLQVIIGMAIKLTVLLALAFITNTVMEALLILVVFASLRMFAGGYHMDSYGLCLGVSIGMFMLFALIAHYTYMYWNGCHIIGAEVIVVATSFFSLYKWAPSDNPNRRIIDKTEIRKFKCMSIVYLVIWTVVSALFIYLKSYVIYLSMFFGLKLEVFSITPAGHMFFCFIKKHLH